MIRRSLYSLTVATCLASLVTCSRENHKPQSSASQQSAVAVKNGSDEVRAVLFDHIRPQKPPGVRMQVLIDTSASMKGFKSSLPSILHAIDEGLSYSRDLYFALQSKRTCFFDQTRGIFGCQPRVDGVPMIDASGYTNLDKAVRMAGDYELSIILTDGVPSSLSSGRECVGSGVDAACVSEAMSDVLRGMSGTSQDKLRGVWLVPIVTPYDGIFFAEQPIAPHDFDSRSAESNVRNDLGVNVRIDKPHTGADGTLLFEYRGPRMLLALVVGDVEPSRAFLQELFSHTEFSHIGTLSQPKSYQSGIAILPVVEVFPSTLPLQEYQTCHQNTDARGRIQGDLINCTAQGANRFRLACRPKPSSAELLLSAKDTARALRLELLAPATLVSSRRGGVKNVTLGSIGPDGSIASTLKAQVSCNSKEPVRCGSLESQTELTSVGDLQAAANDLASPSSAIGRYMRTLSTTQPAQEPHKIYGLVDLLENLYRRKLPNSKASFAILEFCEE